jgi:hypothetical protein
MSDATRKRYFEIWHRLEKAVDSQISAEPSFPSGLHMFGTLGWATLWPDGTIYGAGGVEYCDKIYNDMRGFISDYMKNWLENYIMDRFDGTATQDDSMPPEQREVLVTPNANA